MADAIATKNDVQIEDAGPARKRITVTIPAESISEKIKDSIGALATEAVLPGFRKGRAPRQLIERRFGTSVRDEARNQLIADAYAKAVEESELKPLGDPEPVESFDELQIEEGQSLSFSVHVEVVPDFELPDVSNLKVNKPMLEISDEHVDLELQRQCMRFGSAGSIA